MAHGAPDHIQHALLCCLGGEQRDSRVVIDEVGDVLEGPFPFPFPSLALATSAGLCVLSPPLGGDHRAA